MSWLTVFCGTERNETERNGTTTEAPKGEYYYNNYDNSQTLINVCFMIPYIQSLQMLHVNSYCQSASSLDLKKKSV